MSKPDIMKLTREALADCGDETLDKVDRVAEAIGGLFETIAPVKSVKARVLMGFLRQLVTDERVNRDTKE